MQQNNSAVLPVCNFQIIFGAAEMALHYISDTEYPIFNARGISNSTEAFCDFY
jgi:hypothetical protein